MAWALEDTKYFTMDCDNLIISTDHKPLVKILGDKSLDEISNMRIFRLKQRPLMWQFKITHIPGCKIPASDAASRYPGKDLDKVTERTTESDHLCSSENLHTIDSHIIATNTLSLSKLESITWERVKSATNANADLHELKQQHIIHGFPKYKNELTSSLQPYWRFRNDLSIIDEVIMFEDRIVIPPSLRDKVCHILHSAHQGTTHMSERARATLFWPGMSKHITEMRERCTTCWKLSPSQPFQPPADPTIPSTPFEAIAADYCTVGGYHYLITVDRFSNWPEVTKVVPNSRNSGAPVLIRALKGIFRTFGVPLEISTDGGPEFIRNRKFSQTMGSETQALLCIPSPFKWSS